MAETEIIIDKLTKRFEDVIAIDELCLNARVSALTSASIARTLTQMTQENKK